MNEILKKAENATLWGLLCDVTALLELRQYKPDPKDNTFMFWYQLYKEIEKEIDTRMLRDY